MSGVEIANGIIAQLGSPWQGEHIYLRGIVVEICRKHREPIAIESSKIWLVNELREKAKNQDFTYMDLDVIHDNTLSWKARGIYGAIQYLQQHKGIDFPTIEDVVSQCGKDRKSSVASGMKELKEAGIIPIRPPLKQHRKPGRVYLLFSPDWSLYKIGLSEDVGHRINLLKIELKIQIQYVDSFQTEDMGLDETLLHMHYAKRRVKGEWFDLTGLDPMGVLRGAS